METKIKRYFCTACGWKGNTATIVGIKYPFTLVCPECGRMIIDKKERR